jgi:hypothetical protein
MEIKTMLMIISWRDFGQKFNSSTVIQHDIAEQIISCDDSSSLSQLFYLNLEAQSSEEICKSSFISRIPICIAILIELAKSKMIIKIKKSFQLNFTEDSFSSFLKF